jgi:hypothetical protein
MRIRFTRAILLAAVLGGLTGCASSGAGGAGTTASWWPWGKKQVPADTMASAPPQYTPQLPSQGATPAGLAGVAQAAGGAAAADAYTAAAGGGYPATGYEDYGQAEPYTPPAGGRYDTTYPGTNTGYYAETSSAHADPGAYGTGSYGGAAPRYESSATAEGAAAGDGYAAGDRYDYGAGDTAGQYDYGTSTPPAGDRYAGSYDTEQPGRYAETADAQYRPGQTGYQPGATGYDAGQSSYGAAGAGATATPPATSPHYRPGGTSDYVPAGRYGERSSPSLLDPPAASRTTGSGATGRYSSEPPAYEYPDTTPYYRR